MVSEPNADFVITDDACTNTSLSAHGGTCTFAVQLRPVTCGNRSATITVAGPSGVTGVLSVSGVGTSSSHLVFDRAALDFGFAQLGQSSTVETVTVNLAGCGSSTAPLTLTGSGSVADFLITASTCSAALTAGGSCSLSIAFAPLTTGPKRASYTVTDGAISATVSVDGVGIP